MRRLLLLSAVAAAVWVLAVWLPGEDLESPESGVPGPEQSVADGQWIDFSDGAVDRVVIRNPSGDIELFKEAGEWFVNPPESKPVRAKRGESEALTAFLRGHPPLRRLETGADSLGQYGLDNAGRGISVYADGEAFTLMLGELNPAADGIYAMAHGPFPAGDDTNLTPAGKEVLLVDADYASRLTGGADRYFDLRALDMNREALASIRVEGPEGAERSARWEIAFDQDNATQTSFTWPESLQGKEVSLMEADSYATRLLALEGTEYYEPDAANGIEQEPAFTIYVRRRGSETPERLAFSIHRPADADPLDAKNIAFVLETDWQTKPLVVAAEDMDSLMRTAFSMRERSILHSAAHAIKRVEAAYVQPGAGTKNATAVFKDGSWGLEASGRELPEFGMTVWRLADLAFTDEPREVLPADANSPLVVRIYGEGLDEDGLEVAWYEISHGVGTLVSAGGVDGPYYPVGEGGRIVADELIGQLFEEARPAVSGDAPAPADNASATSP